MKKACLAPLYRSPGSGESAARRAGYANFAAVDPLKRMAMIPADWRMIPKTLSST